MCLLVLLAAGTSFTPTQAWPFWQTQYHLLKEKKNKKKAELQLQINTLELPLKVQSPWPKPSIQKAFKHMYN